MKFFTHNKKKNPGAEWIFGAMLAALAVLSLLTGAARYSLSELLTEKTVLLYIRLPRTGGCILTGAALASAGLLLQSVLNNSLAGPGVIGVNSGAGFAVVLAAVLFPGSAWAGTAGAFLGALITVFPIYAAARIGGISRATLVLAGVAVSGLFSALIDTLITLFPAAAAERTAFSIGSFASVDPTALNIAFPAAAAALVGARILSSRLDILILGDESAASLGVRVGRCRFFALLISAVLSATAVCVSGLIGFLGLMVPHIVRRLAGCAEHGRMLGLCALCGACLSLACDVLAKTVMMPYELPVGIFLSALGVPFFLYLLFHNRRRQSFVSDQ